MMVCFVYRTLTLKRWVLMRSRSTAKRTEADQLQASWERNEFDAAGITPSNPSCINIQYSIFNVDSRRDVFDALDHPEVSGSRYRSIVPGQEYRIVVHRLCTCLFDRDGHPPFRHSSRTAPLTPSSVLSLQTVDFLFCHRPSCFSMTFFLRQDRRCHTKEDRE